MRNKSRGHWIRWQSKCISMLVALLKDGKRSIGQTKGGLNTKLYVLCFDACHPYLFFLSGGQGSDYKAGVELLLFAGVVPDSTPLLMDRAYYIAPAHSNICDILPPPKT